MYTSTLCRKSETAKREKQSNNVKRVHTRTRTKHQRVEESEKENRRHGSQALLSMVRLLSLMMSDKCRNEKA
jgi:hypothetical protein